MITIKRKVYKSEYMTNLYDLTLEWEKSSTVLDFSHKGVQANTTKRSSQLQITSQNQIAAKLSTQMSS